MLDIDLIKILIEMNKIAAEKLAAEIFCPECGERRMWIKHGFYYRYLFDGGEQTAVQRYLCQNPECPRRTFSILPYPFLRIVRLPMCMLILLLDCFTRGETIASLSRTLGKGKGVVRRAIATASKLRPWIQSEAPVASWGSDPNLDPRKSWTDFIHDFSHVFYPVLY